jgi:deferrochelatase/peroxidase EfeB
MGTPGLKLENIQGNILGGFNKDFQCFLLVNFPATGDAKGWLSGLAPEVASTAEVTAFNTLFKLINERHGAEPGTVKATWMNLALSASGLQALGVSTGELEAFSASFRAGMSARAPFIGDEGANAPQHWVQPLGSTDVHALVLLASDDPEDLDAAILRHVERLGDRDLRLLFQQDGWARSDLPGHEHFGFKDGISQPGIRGIAPASVADPNQGQPGQALLWPGEFVLGYPTQQKYPNPAPIEGPPGYGSGQTPPATSTSDLPTEPGPVEVNGPEWAADGSYLVFRRLRQDVAAFNDFLEKTTATEGSPAALVGAKLVRRYKSGCPLEHTPDESADIDPQTLDPSIADPTLLSDAKINNFEYDGDTDGALVPRAAHIRKVYPRNEPTPGGRRGGHADSSPTATRHRLRRALRPWRAQQLAASGQRQLPGRPWAAVPLLPALTRRSVRVHPALLGQQPQLPAAERRSGSRHRSARRTQHVRRARPANARAQHRAVRHNHGRRVLLCALDLSDRETRRDVGPGPTARKRTRRNRR